MENEVKSTRKTKTARDDVAKKRTAAAEPKPMRRVRKKDLPDTPLDERLASLKHGDMALPKALRELDEAEMIATVYEARLLGMTLPEICAKTGMPMTKIKEALDRATERFLSELDDMKRTYVATNLMRLEQIIGAGMNQVAEAKKKGEMANRDTITGILGAIRLGKELVTGNTPAIVNNTAVQFNATVSRTSPVYEHAMHLVHKEDIEHRYAEEYADKITLREDSRYKRLEGLVGVEVLEEADNGNTETETG